LKNPIIKKIIGFFSVYLLAKLFFLYYNKATNKFILQSYTTLKKSEVIKMKLFTDSNCEMSFECLKELGLELIRMPYILDGEMNYYDLGENINIGDFYKSMREGSVAKTTALNEHDYTEYFKPALESGEDILYISFAHSMSATFESMNKAIDTLKIEYPDRTITCIDTCLISVAGGEMVRRVALAYKEGALLGDIIKLVERLREKIVVYFTVDDLEYLRRGGRISRMKSFVGSILGVKPVLHMNSAGGYLEKIGAAKGRKAALKQMAGFALDNEIDKEQGIIILYAECIEDANQIKELLEEKYSDVNIKLSEVGPVVGAHSGPGTIGVCFTKK